MGAELKDAYRKTTGSHAPRLLTFLLSLGLDMLILDR